jgi:uncharacterized membrane protein YhaH (DUF805 family)
MNFMDAVKTCFKKYADFNGRARPSEHWWFFLFLIIASTIIGAISDKLSMIFTLATLIPYLAVVSRRLHDINLSGWNQLWWNLGSVIGLICLVYGFASMFFPNSGTSSMAIGGFGALILLASFALFIYYMIKAGDATDNQYGPPAAN